MQTKLEDKPPLGSKLWNPLICRSRTLSLSLSLLLFLCGTKALLILIANQMRCRWELIARHLLLS